MRALAACLTVFLGLGAMTALATTMAACSDTSDAGSGGASGASAGAGGAACSFESLACSTCLSTKCTAQLTACGADASCKTALGALTPCVCGGTDVNTCAGTFAKDGGDPALKLDECYTLNCEADCM